MSDIIIFVSCGQRTPAEISLGKRVAEIIDNELGFKAHFAEDVHDLAGLNDSIYKALAQCSGMVAFLHDRGEFVDKKGQSSHVCSTWINQEIAVLS